MLRLFSREIGRTQGTKDSKRFYADGRVVKLCWMVILGTSLLVGKVGLIGKADKA